MSNIVEERRAAPIRPRRIGFSDTHIVDSIFKSYHRGDVTGMLNLEDWSRPIEVSKLILSMKTKVATHMPSNRNRAREIAKTIVSDAFGYDNYNGLRTAWRETHGRDGLPENRTGGRKTRKMRKKGKSRKSRKSQKNKKRKF